MLCLFTAKIRFFACIGSSSAIHENRGRRRPRFGSQKTFRIFFANTIANGKRHQTFLQIERQRLAERHVGVGDLCHRWPLRQGNNVVRSVQLRPDLPFAQKPPGIEPVELNSMAGFKLADTLYPCTSLDSDLPFEMGFCRKANAAAAHSPTYGHAADRRFLDAMEIDRRIGFLVGIQTVVVPRKLVEFAEKVQLFVFLVNVICIELGMAEKQCHYHLQIVRFHGIERRFGGHVFALFRLFGGGRTKQRIKKVAIGWWFSAQFWGGVVADKKRGEFLIF